MGRRVAGIGGESRAGTGENLAIYAQTPRRDGSAALRGLGPTSACVERARRLRARRDQHREAVANHQRASHFDLGPMTRDEARVEPPREQSREDMGFEHRKAVADADPLPAAERKVREGMATLFTFGKKAIWIEALRIVPEVGMPVR